MCCDVTCCDVTCSVPSFLHAPFPCPAFHRNNLEATQELSHCILSRVMSVVNNHHLSPNIATAVQPEVNLLLATLAIKDQCWEHRLRTGEGKGGAGGGWVGDVMLVEYVLVLLAYDWFFAVHSAFNRHHDSLAFQNCFEFSSASGDPVPEHTPPQQPCGGGSGGTALPCRAEGPDWPPSSPTAPTEGGGRGNSE